MIRQNQVTGGALIRKNTIHSVATSCELPCCPEVTVLMVKT